MTKGYSRSYARTACCLTALAVFAVLTTLGVPAGAVEAGSGQWTGSLNYSFASAGVGALPPCGLFSSASAVDGTPGPSGNYTATNGLNTVTYTGALDVTWEALESYYAGPHGIYSDPLCTRPKTVLVKSTVMGTSNGVSVACSYRGQFTRRDTNNFVNALTGTCTLSNSTHTITTAAAETRVAQFTSCVGGGPPSGCTSNEQALATLADS